MIIRIYRQRSWKSEKLTQFIYINIKRKWRSKNLRCNHNVIFGKSAIPKSSIQFSSVQSLSRVRLLATPWIAARQASLSITNSRSLLQLMPIESVMPSSHLILCHPLLLLCPTPPSIRIFSNESALHIRWPKYWSFSFNISPSNEHPGLISFRLDWLDLLAVQGTLKSLLQHHSSKASILRRSVLFTVQLSHPYMTTGKPQLDQTDLCKTYKVFLTEGVTVVSVWATRSPSNLKTFTLQSSRGCSLISKTLQSPAVAHSSSTHWPDSECLNPWFEGKILGAHIWSFSILIFSCNPKCFQMQINCLILFSVAKRVGGVAQSGIR